MGVVILGPRTDWMPRNELEAEVDRLRLELLTNKAELVQVYDALGRVQTRCTEQLEETRQLKKELLEVKRP